MRRSVLTAIAGFAFVTLSAVPVQEVSAGADKSSCRRVAKSAGLMSAVIDQACSSYKEYQKTCLRHVGRDGIPDLVRADNYVQCLCSEAKRELRSDANQLCHASSSIHGLLDEPMLLVQTAAIDTDKKQEALLSREKSLDKLRKREALASKEAQKAEKDFGSVKQRTDTALAKNQQSQEKARKIYEQTVAKLRAAEKAAQQKFERLSAELDQDNQKLKRELATAHALAARERARHGEVSQAMSIQQRDVGMAKNTLATAISRENKAIESHRDAIGSNRVTTHK